MKLTYLLMFVLIFSIFNGCGNNTKRQELDEQYTKDSIERVVEIAKKKAAEEERIKVEQEIQQKDVEKRMLDEIRRKEAERTYTVNDLIGEWEVRMECIKSSCEGNDIGTIRVERWFIEYINREVSVRVEGSSNTPDYYKGRFDGKHLILAFTKKKPGWFSNEKITVDVNLLMTNNSALMGSREVLNPGPCQIKYNVTANKK